MLNPLVFYLIAITLIPLGLGPESELLAQLAPGMLWVMALLATLLALDGLFRSDFDDGSLEQLLISPQLLYFSVLAKVFAHWLVTGDRKSTRLNSSHVAISYAVFCLQHNTSEQ